MSRQKDKLTILFMVCVLALSVVLVDARWTRAFMALLPGLLLAQRALLGVGVGSKEGGATERRSDFGIREQIQELLGLIRDFYTTCHMVAVGQLEPSKAKAKAQSVERRLSQMMSEMLERVESAESA